MAAEREWIPVPQLLAVPRPVAPRHPTADVLLAQSGRGASVALLVLALLVVVAVVVGRHLWLRRKEQDLQRLLDRDTTLRRTTTPCGLTAAQLAGRFAATPRGDRRTSLDYAVTGPLEFTAAGARVVAECCSFQWRWEERRTRTDKRGTHTTYERRRCVAALVRLPASSPGEVRIAPASVLGRLGITRGGLQVESSEFNRRFRVEGTDRTLTVRLLDAGLQQRLLAEFDGRSLDLTGDLVALGGRPSHRDTGLLGVVGELPAVRQDVQRILEAVPAQFWRATGLVHTGDEPAALPRAPHAEG